MKRIFLLIGKEAKYLKRTILLIGVILMIFVAALLSVISVLLDMPDGIYSGYNEYFGYHMISVQNVDTYFAEEFGGTSIYGHIDGITRYAVLTGNSAMPTTPLALDSEENQAQPASLTLSIYAMCENTSYIFDPYTQNNALKAGDWPTNPGEVAINADVAKLIGASLGDEIILSPNIDQHNPDEGIDIAEVTPMAFTIVGLFGTDLISTLINATPRTYMLPAAHLYIIVEDGQQFSTLNISYTDSKTLHSSYKKLINNGYDPTITTGNYDIISTAQAFFGAITCVLGLMVMFIIYTLIAIFYRQRKGQICRLKLLGAKESTIAWIYCSIAIFLVLVAVVIGTFLAMAFNLYFMNLCGQLFSRISSNFVSNFHPIIQLYMFAALSLFTLIIFFAFNRKIKTVAISREVRHE